MQIKITPDDVSFQTGTMTNFQQLQRVIEAGKWLKEHRPDLALVVNLASGDYTEASPGPLCGPPPKISDGVRIHVDALVESILDP